MDVSFVLTIPLSKNDRFYFSRKYDPEIIEPLLHKAHYLDSSIKQLPLLPEAAARLDEEIIRRSIHGTTAIEGNPLTEEDVGKIISYGNCVHEGNQKAEIEIRNICIAYGKIDVFPQMGFFRLTEDFIRLIHSTVMLDLGEETKGYRSVPVKVGDKEHGGTDHPPGSQKDIQLLMGSFVEWINDDSFISQSPVIRAALAHYHLARIHPFVDGNGRTARLVEALLLQTAGFKYAPKMLSNYYCQHFDDYYRAFSFSRKNKEKEVTPFLEFYLKALVSSLETVKEKVLDLIRFVVLKDYTASLFKAKKINQRQFDLLGLLLEKPVEFAVPDVYASLPFAIIYRGKSERTARRDLNGLIERNLLIQTETGKYELNVHLLDTL